MALKYVVTKRVFGFDKTNTEKYVAKSVGSGKMNFDKMCEKVKSFVRHSPQSGGFGGKRFGRYDGGRYRRGKTITNG